MVARRWDSGSGGGQGEREQCCGICLWGQARKERRGVGDAIEVTTIVGKGSMAVVVGKEEIEMGGI